MLPMAQTGTASEAGGMPGSPARAPAQVRTGALLPFWQALPLLFIPQWP